MSINIRIRSALPLAAAALATVPLGAVSATAAGSATTAVTIKAAGTDLYGTVTSARDACERNRTVHLYKQIGTRGGGDDVRVAQDTTEVANGVGQWSTGNTGMAGRFYAKVKKTTTCRGAVSPTIKVVRA